MGRENDCREIRTWTWQNGGQRNPRAASAIASCRLNAARNKLSFRARHSVANCNLPANRFWKGCWLGSQYQVLFIWEVVWNCCSVHMQIEGMFCSGLISIPYDILQQDTGCRGTVHSGAVLPDPMLFSTFTWVPTLQENCYSQELPQFPRWCPIPGDREEALPSSSSDGSLPLSHLSY